MRNSAAVNDFNRSVCAHDGKFSGGPSHVVVSTNVLAGHHDVGASVGLAQDDGEFGDGGFSKGVEKFCTVTDDATPFLVCSRKETWNILKGDQRDVEGVTEPYETGCFIAGVNVKTTSEHLGLIGHHAYGVSAKMAKANNDVLRPIGLNFHEATIIEDL